MSGGGGPSTTSTVAVPPDTESVVIVTLPSLKVCPAASAASENPPAEPGVVSISSDCVTTEGLGSTWIETPFTTGSVER